MLFNSLTFVIFFAIVYSLYLVLQHRPQNALLLVAAYIFYGWWDWRFLGLIATSTLVDYTFALLIDGATGARRRAYVTVTIVTNLVFLGFFKYFNFFAENGVAVLHALGFSADPITLKIILPVGISFYTFQSMAYTIDVYRGRFKPTRNLFDYAVYVSFFPQLVAGPIERADRLLPQVTKPREITYQKVREGAWLILTGYFKKVVVADNMATIADSVFNHSGDYHGLAVLAGIYAFAFQIYGDFSGYSSIARGIAKLLGFELMVNFRMPYFAQNPQDFWRRWHISFSTWLRDYLYIPLGGSKYGTLKTYRNLFLTMFLGGLWHGAAWNFVAWGTYHGSLLIAHRLLTGRQKETATKSSLAALVKIAVMFQFTCLGWIFFRVNHLSNFPGIMRNLFTPAGCPEHWVLAMITLVLPVFVLHYFEERTGDEMFVSRFRAPQRFAWYCVLFAYVAMCGKANGATFIYFQF